MQPDRSQFVSQKDAVTDPPGTSPFAIEEYKLAKQRISTNEGIRFRLLILNVTAFAAIIGLGEKLPPAIAPFILIAVLVICWRSYLTQSRLQAFTTAFIVVRYERNDPSICLETGYLHWATQVQYPDTDRTFWWKRFRYAATKPFAILTGVSFVAGQWMAFSFLAELYVTQTLAAAMYSIALVALHMLMFIDIYRGRLPAFRDHIEWWTSYLADDTSETPDSD
jgi:hypothetical protein